MPGKHLAPSPAPRRGPILALCAALVLLAGAAAAVLLLWDKFAPFQPQPDPTPLPTPTAAPTPTPTPVPTPSPTPTPTPTPPPIPDNGEDGYLSNGIYIWDGKAFELFYGYDESAQPYAQAIEEFAAALPGIQVYNMVVPNHSEFGLPQRLRDSLNCGSQRTNTAAIYSGYASVKPVDIYEAFDHHKDEYLYFGSDTHWTALGAYYAYEKFCEAAGVQAVSLDSYSLSTVEDFYGYLYEMTGDDTVNGDHIDLYEPGFPYTASLSYDGWEFSPLAGINSGDPSMGYAMFLWGDNPCLRVVNEQSGTGRKLVMVKESYGNAIGPFLAGSFDELYVVDFRSFEGSLPERCAEWGVTDVLFLNSTIAANTYQRVEDLRSLFPEAGPGA